MSTEQASEPKPKSALLLWMVVLLAAVAMLMSWGASALNWFVQRYQTSFAGETSSGATGAVVRPELVPLALAALAAVAAVLATRGWFRRVIGVFIVVAGLLLVWRTGGWLFGAQNFAFVPEGLPSGSKPIGSPTGNPLGSLLGLVGAVVFVAAGALVVFRAGRMPEMGAKYSAPANAKRSSPDPDKRLWDALDEGDDPTTER